MSNRSFSIFYLASQKKFLFCKEPVNSFVYYKDFRIDLLTGIKEKYSIEGFLGELDSIHITDYFYRPKVIHLSYELGHDFVGQKEKISSTSPLAISIEYNKAEVLNELPFKGSDSVDLDLREYPKFDSYKKKFEKVQRYLLQGDCYQVNLTSQFYFKFSEDFEAADFICALWGKKKNIGAYGHCSYIDSLDKLILSNTPECLFQLCDVPNAGKMKIQAMPIKGTIKLGSEEDVDFAFKKLQESKKDEAELYMIADLLRNDIAKIAKTPARIVKNKAKLVVPGIVHQYSLVESLLPSHTSLKQIIQAVFPGGSITGAPKKRVMSIINQLEEYKRNLYCGSTVVFHESMRQGSINIRSAEVELSANELTYGSGGGITLLSKCEDEFDETYTKMRSFIDLLK